MATTSDQIYKICAGLFNAAPGATYLQEFNNLVLDQVAAGSTVDAALLGLSNALAGHAAFTTNIITDTDTTTALQATKLLANFGLTYGATDAVTVAAQTWMEGEINAGTGYGAIVYTAVTALSDAVWVAANSTYADVATTMTNKAAVANYYSVTLGQSSATVATLQSVVNTVTAATPVATTADLAAAAGAATGSTLALTTGTDTLFGTVLSDTFTGASGTVEDADSIVDSSTTDNDTANLVVTAAYTPTAITNVENVNIDWNAFGTATVDTTAVTGASAITLTSSKLGFLGSSAITAGASQHLVAGTGMVGTMTVTGATTAVTVDATNSKVVSVTGTGIATVNAGASTTTVTTSGFTTATIDAGTATSVTITDAAGSTNATALTVNGNATIVNTITGTQAITASGDTLTMNALATAGTTINGTGAIVINSTGLTGKTVTNGIAAGAGTLTFKSSVAGGAQDVSKVSADLIEFTGAVAGVITTKNNANIKLSGNAGASTLTVTGSGTADVLNVEVTGATQTGLIQAVATETVSMTANATLVSGTDLTLATYNTNGKTLNLLGTNDVSMTNVTTGGTIDASGLTGKLTVTQVAGATHNLAVTGGSGNLSVTGTSALAETLTVVGGAGDDTVITALATGAATATLGEGANTVTAAALTAGTLVVIAGAGVDTVTTDSDDSNITLELGDGNNVVTVTYNTAVNAADDNLVLTTGAGNDTLEIVGSLQATDNLTLTLGGGTNTLVLGAAADISAATISETGLSAIEMTGGGAASTVAAGLVSGKAISVTATATAGDIFTVVGTTAGGETIDLSTLTMSQNITTAVISTSITGNAGADTITGTSIADAIATGGGNDTVTGGLGADIYTGGAGVDTFVIATADTGATVATADKINVASFTTTTDKLKLGVAGSVTNYVEVAGVANDTFTLASDDANTAMDGTVKYVFIYGLDADVGTGGLDGADGVLFIDNDMNGTFDDVIVITGAATAAALAFGDIIA